MLTPKCLQAVIVCCASIACTGTAHAVLRSSFCTMTDGNNTRYITGVFVQSYGSLSLTGPNAKYVRLVTAFAKAVKQQYPNVRQDSLVGAGCFGREPEYADDKAAAFERSIFIKQSKQNHDQLFDVKFDAVD